LDVQLLRDDDDNDRAEPGGGVQKRPQLAVATDGGAAERVGPSASPWPISPRDVVAKAHRARHKRARSASSTPRPKAAAAPVAAVGPAVTAAYDVLGHALGGAARSPRTPPVRTVGAPESGSRLAVGAAAPPFAATGNGDATPPSKKKRKRVTFVGTTNIASTSSAPPPLPRPPALTSPTDAKRNSAAPPLPIPPPLLSHSRPPTPTAPRVVAPEIGVVADDATASSSASAAPAAFVRNAAVAVGGSPSPAAAGGAALVDSAPPAAAAVVARLRPAFVAWADDELAAAKASAYRHALDEYFASRAFEGLSLAFKIANAASLKRALEAVVSGVACAGTALEQYIVFLGGCSDDDRRDAPAAAPLSPASFAPSQTPGAACDDVLRGASNGEAEPNGAGSTPRPQDAGGHGSAEGSGPRRGDDGTGGTGGSRRSGGGDSAEIGWCTLRDLPRGCNWAALKDFCGRVAPVRYVNVLGTVGVVEFATRESHASGKHVF